MKIRKTNTHRHLSWIVMLSLVFTMILSACSSSTTQSTDVAANQAEQDKNSSVVDDSSSEEDSSVEEESSVEEQVKQAPEWPEDFSLYETYQDDFLLGTIYTDNNRGGKDYELTTKQFNTITPENLMKPEYMQPSEGRFNYSSSDVMMNFAKTNNLNVVGHTLAWHQQTGNWLGRNVSRDEAIEQLKSHITNIVGKYKGQIISWDVVNEAIQDGVELPANGDWTQCLRRTQWLDSIGSDYLAMAFTFAHEADPDVKLYYNDYNLNNKKKADIVYAMVKDLQGQGIPVHGIGMQGHYSTDTSVGSVEYSLKLFSQLDVEVSITELDISVNGASASGLTEQQEIAQGISVAKLFQLFKEYKDTVARVTFWGYVDNKSWRSENFPCLFNSDYTPKLAAYAVLDPDKFLAYYDNAAPVEAKTAKAKKGTPTIDGEIESIWDNSEKSDIKSQVTAWEGATGTVRLLWDEAFVYALFEVKDGLLNKSSENLYEQDSIEIFLDQKNEKNEYYDENDGQYRVNYVGTTSFGTVPTTQGFQAAAKEVSGGYVIELAIPLLNKATEGMIMGFDGQINDSNESGIRQSISKFNDITDNSWNATDKWGNLELVK